MSKRRRRDRVLADPIAGAAPFIAQTRANLVEILRSITGRKYADDMLTASLASPQRLQANLDQLQMHIVALDVYEPLRRAYPGIWDLAGRIAVRAEEVRNLLLGACVVERPPTLH